MNDTNETPYKKKKSIFSYLKWIPIFMICAVIALLAFVIMRFRNDAAIPYNVSTEGITIPKYTEVEIPFEHKYVKATQIQATGGCAFNLTMAPKSFSYAAAKTSRTSSTASPMGSLSTSPPKLVSKKKTYPKLR